MDVNEELKFCEHRGVGGVGVPVGGVSGWG